VTLDHAGGERRAECDNRLHQDPHLLQLPLGISRVERATGGEPCVVDEDVDIKPERLDPARQPRAGGGLGEVACDRLGADAVLGRELPPERNQAVLAAGDEHDVVAALCELARDLCADAGRSARDQRGRR